MAAGGGIRTGGDFPELFWLVAGKAGAQTLGERAFPDDAAEDLKKRRRLSLLRARLSEAAGREDYEEAAKLRDDIAVMEKEVCSHEG